MAKVVFMGSPAFAVPSLRALHGAGHEIVAVYSQPPRPAGRGQKLQKTAVHELADELGLTVYTPARLRGDDLEFVMGLEADVFCVVAYGLLLPKRMVDERLCLNVHPSALPRWRGAAPLQWTLLSGDEATDICVMRLDEGMDTGPVVAREHLKLNHAITLGELHDMTASMGAEMLEDVVGILPDIKEVDQEGKATLAPKIDAGVRAIDWSKPALEIHNKVRGLSPAPGATARFGDEVVKILRSEIVDGFGKAGEVLAIDADGITVGCNEASLRIVEMQRPGGKPARAADLARGWNGMVAGAVFA
ncbi:MAG: methionyl-tRNA formyltransferase [Alphaproteobacteria bacterium]|nr:MAG: methionyl-tRNA formyltransferase [Alphaproteobacteria bacterium]